MVVVAAVGSLNMCCVKDKGFGDHADFTEEELCQLQPGMAPHLRQGAFWGFVLLSTVRGAPATGHLCSRTPARDGFLQGFSSPVASPFSAIYLLGEVTLFFRTLGQVTQMLGQCYCCSFLSAS